jgi:hypothetical protein
VISSGDSQKTSMARFLRLFRDSDWDKNVVVDKSPGEFNLKSL